MSLWDALKSKSPETEERFKTVEDLAKRGHSRAFELIVKSLADEDAQVRCTAVKSLAELRDEQSVQALMYATEDSSGEVREAAAIALGQLGDPQATGQLAHLLNDSKDAVRISAGTALKSLGWTPTTRDEKATFEVALEKARDAAQAGKAASFVLRGSISEWCCEVRG